MGFTTSYWQKERWSRRAADTLTSYGRCWNRSLGNWEVNWRVGVLSEEQTPQVIVFSEKLSEKSRAFGQALAFEKRYIIGACFGLLLGGVIAAGVDFHIPPPIVLVPTAKYAEGYE